MNNKNNGKYKALLIYDKERGAKNQDYIQMHQQVGERFGITFDFVYGEESDSFLVDNKPDFAIMRMTDYRLSKKLEQLGIPVFNNSTISQICNDKYLTLTYVEEHAPDVPIVSYRFFFNHELSENLCQTHPNCVIKAVDGHGGSQVFSTKESFEVIKKQMGNSDFLIQPFIHGPGKDVRVYVIGNKIIGAIERTAEPGEFRSNFSLGGHVKNYKLKEDEFKLVNQIIRLFDFGMVGIDFIIDDKGHFVFNEIEDVVGARMLFHCNPGIDLLEQYFSHILSRIGCNANTD